MARSNSIKFASLALAASACMTNSATYAQAPGSASKPVELEEIVVTAQKVESTVQKTPIAIQTVSNETLMQQGIQNTQDLTKIVPGLSVTLTGGGSSFFIRGVGTYNETSASDSGLALSLDQMYFSRPYGPDMALYDVQRVEVLKGPQGTLYGRNATGGSINIISKKPTLDKFGGEVGLEFGNYRAVKANAAANLPVTDTIAMRVAFQSNRHNGYMKDGYDDADTTAGRLHVLWQPSDSTSLLLTGEYMHNGQKGPGNVPYPNFQFLTNDPWEGGASATARAYVRSHSNPAASNITNATFANGAVVNDPRNCLPGCNQVALFAPTDQPGPFNTEKNGFVDVTVISYRGDLEQNFGFATLSVIPAYLLTDAKVLYNNSGTGIYTTSKDHQGSFEARLTSPQDQAFTWIGGVFYQREKQIYSTFNAGGFPNLVSYGYNPDVRTVSKAIFAQVNYKIIDTLTATLGARSTKENKSTVGAYGGSETYPAVPGPFPPPQPGFSPPTDTKYDSSATTYRAGLDWQVTPSNLLYTSYSTGFHAGGFNSGTIPTQPICTPQPNFVSPAQFAAAYNNGCDIDIFFKPEHLDAIALGSKNRFFNNRVQLNVEVYDWKYKDLQAFSLQPTNAGGGNKSITLFTSNAGNSKIRGLDLEASWLITADDLVTLNYNYNKSTYGTFVTYFYIPGSPLAFVTNYTGKPFLNAPNSVLNFGYQHTFNLGNGGKLVPSIDGKYSSKVTYSYGPDMVQTAYTKYNVNLGYSAPTDAWSVNAFVRNVGNKATIVRAVQNAPATGIPWVFLAAPRTYGVNVSTHF